MGEVVPTQGWGDPWGFLRGDGPGGKGGFPRVGGVWVNVSTYVGGLGGRIPAWVGEVWVGDRCPWVGRSLGIPTWVGEPPE